VVERYISGQKGEEREEKGEGRGKCYSYEEKGAMPVVVIDGEKGKAHKTWYITLYDKLFRTSQK
jgi:hypothetical protein